MPEELSQQTETGGKWEDAIEDGLRDAIYGIQNVCIQVPPQPLYAILRKFGKDVADAALTAKDEQLREASELLREIRDGEVNPEDEADKYLRDHVPSELSQLREQRRVMRDALDGINNLQTLVFGTFQGIPAHAKTIASAALASVPAPKEVT